MCVLSPETLFKTRAMSRDGHGVVLKVFSLGFWVLGLGPFGRLRSTQNSDPSTHNSEPRSRSAAPAKFRARRAHPLFTGRERRRLPCGWRLPSGPAPRGGRDPASETRTEARR